MDFTRTDCSNTDPECRAARELAQRDGVMEPGNLPFFLAPENVRTAVLLVHGFTASPWEMRLLAEHLAEAGYAALAVRLPGHGTTPEDLAKRRWKEWFSAVERGHAALARSYDKIFCAGMSTGSLLSVQLALQAPLAGLVLFSPYLRIQHHLANHVHWLRFLRPYHTSRTRVDRDYTHYYDRRPIAGVHQINLLLRHLKPRLSECSAPVLAFNGESDRTVVVESGRELVEALGSDLKIYQRLGPDVPHILTREENPCYQALFAATLQFIRALEELDQAGETDSGTGLRSRDVSVRKARNCQ